MLSISLFSCVKENTGPQGLPGDDGSTPELYYFDIPVNSYNKEPFYEDNSVDYNNAWVSYGYIDGVTIQENDLVMVFMHQTTDGGPDNYFQALPYNDFTDGTVYYNHYSYGVMDNNGDLIFSIRRNDGSDPFLDMNASWTIQYNVYLLKGTASRKAELPADIYLKDEAALKAYLNVSERKKVNFISR